MGNKKVMAVALSLTLALSVGCSAKEDKKATAPAGEVKQEKPVEQAPKQEEKKESKPEVKQEEEKKDIIADFNALLAKSPKLPEISKFIEKNIDHSTKEEGSKLVIAFEEQQKKYLPKLEEKYYQPGSIQEKISKVYKPGVGLNKPESISDKEVKNLLTETLNSGYKVETAEGTFFPVIDYSFYNKFSAHITEDLKAYIDIMMIESDKVPAKDAGLMITWEEVLKRAAQQAEFIGQYGSSVKAEDMKRLYNRYVTFTLFGLNNTPLFEYETKQMNGEAKKAYLNMAAKNGEGNFAQLIKEYVEVLKKSDYKLTPEIEKFRKAKNPAQS